MFRRCQAQVSKIRLTIVSTSSTMFLATRILNPVVQVWSLDTVSLSLHVQQTRSVIPIGHEGFKKREAERQNAECKADSRQIWFRKMILIQDDPSHMSKWFVGSSRRRTCGFTRAISNITTSASICSQKLMGKQSAHHSSGQTNSWLASCP